METYRSWSPYVLLALLVGCAGKDTTRQPPPEAPAQEVRAAPRPGPAGGSEELPPADAELRKLLGELRGEYKTRSAARKALVERGEAVTPYLVPLLKDRDYLYRWRVVNVLGYIGDPTAIPAIAELVLSETNPHPRYRAHWALRNLERSGDTCRELFAKELDGPDHFRAWNAAVALAYFFDERALPMVHEKLQSPDEYERWEAVTSLANIHDDESSALIEPLLLRDSWKKVRHEAVMSLGDICDAKAVELLTRVLDFRDSGVRWRAARALGDCGNPASIPALKALLEKERNDTVRKHTRNALAELGAEG